MTLGKPIRVWDPATREKLAEFDGTDAVFSPDGRMVASVNIARNEMMAHIWEARTGKSVAQTQHGRGVVQTVAFSPDAKWLVTISGDNNVGIWEAGTGRALRQFTSSRKILSARFASGARWLVLTLNSDSGDRMQLYPWERFAPTDDLIDWARTLVVRKLYSNEMYRYGIKLD
jgi:WD40 repeat protein